MQQNSDHLVGECEEPSGHGDAKGFRGPQIDHQLALRGLHCHTAPAGLEIEVILDREREVPVCERDFARLAVAG